MLKATDLRIGNKIIANGLHEGRIMTVEQIGTKATLRDESRVILFKEHDVGEFVKDCKGITVTIELLINNCGFTDCANNGWGCRLYLNNTDELFFGIQDKLLRYQTRGSGFTRNFDIKNIHQLQNLYYLLTAKELEVTL